MKKGADDENEAKVQNTKEPEIMRDTPQKIGTTHLPPTIKTNLETINENCIRRLHNIDGDDENGANGDEVLCCDIDQTQLKQRRHKRCQKRNIKRDNYDLRNIENAFLDTHGISINMPSASSVTSLPSYSIPTTTTSPSSSSLSSSGSKSSNATTFVNNYSRRVKTTTSTINNNSKNQVSHQKYQQQKIFLRRKKEYKQKLKREGTFSELNEKSAIQAVAIEQLIPMPTSRTQCQMEEQQQHQHDNQQVKSSQGNNDMNSKKDL